MVRRRGPTDQPGSSQGKMAAASHQRPAGCRLASPRWQVIPKEVAAALAKGARSHGVTVLENVRVLDVLHRAGRATGVRVQSGAGVPPARTGSRADEKIPEATNGQAGHL